MLSFEVLGAFFVTSLVMAVVPGPDNIFVLTQSALYGARAGLVAMLGMVSGLCMHTALVALGVAAVFQTSAFAFAALKMVGAAYLLYLAWLSFRSGAARMSSGRGSFVGYAALYRRGALMSMTNPKLTLFFLAFLPQFADPARGSLPLQIALLGMLFQIASLMVFSLIALLGGELAKRFNDSPRAQIMMNQIAGTIFVGLACLLVFSNR